MKKAGVPQWQDSMLPIFEAWNTQSLVLFLGAGVSIPYGIPDWNDLVLELLLDRRGVPLEERHLHRVALGGAIEHLLGHPPTTLARVIKPRDWGQDDLNRLRDVLYRNVREDGEDTLTAIVDLIQKSWNNGRFAIRGVVTSNFDDLLETRLMERRIPIDVIYQRDQRPAGNALPIYHVHGYLPRGRNVPLQQQIVFTEDEYHDLTYQSFQWATIELTHFMRTARILFIGCSMADPNIRRLLDATSLREDQPRHFAFRLRRECEEIKRALRDRLEKELGADRHDRLRSIIDDAYEQAADDDADALRQLGVTLVPVSTYGEIAQHLRGLDVPKTAVRTGDVRQRARLHPRGDP